MLANEAPAKTAAGTYFFKDRCPRPGKTKADNRTAFVDFFIDGLPNIMLLEKGISLS
jgi:hypothetical protein